MAQDDKQPIGSEEPSSSDASREPQKQEEKQEEKKEVPGNVKLLGVAGLCKGEEFSITLGQEVLVGRSRECDICLHDLPKVQKLEEQNKTNKIVEEHFRTVSRKHLRIRYHSCYKIELEDLSSNGLYLDGKLVDGSLIIQDLMDAPRELRLGKKETFALDWWKLLPKSQVPMVKIKVKRKSKSAEGPSPEKSDQESENEAEKPEENKQSKEPLEASSEQSE